MKKIRCAIYTRKSAEEGLEQEFNSLDAQREACAAYVASQKADVVKASSTGKAVRFRRLARLRPYIKTEESGIAVILIAKSSKHENAKQPHWAQARSSCWGTRSPPL